MSVNSYEELKKHLGHKIVCVSYGQRDNISLECETCQEVIIDYDRK
jgi:hypothetical protein